MDENPKKATLYKLKHDDVIKYIDRILSSYSTITSTTAKHFIDLEVLKKIESGYLDSESSENEFFTSALLTLCMYAPVHYIVCAQINIQLDLYKIAFRYNDRLGKLSVTNCHEVFLSYAGEDLSKNWVMCV